MRWPFGPPHLTLKPSKKQNQKNKHKKEKKHKKYQKLAFQVSVKFSFFWWVSKISFFDTLTQKRVPKKHYTNRGFSTVFLKNRCASRNGHFWTKKPKTRDSSYHLFLPFSSLSTTNNNKKHKKCAKTLFYSVLGNLKKRIFKC